MSLRVYRQPVRIACVGVLALLSLAVHAMSAEAVTEPELLVSSVSPANGAVIPEAMVLAQSGISIPIKVETSMAHLTGLSVIVGSESAHGGGALQRESATSFGGSIFAVDPRGAAGTYQWHADGQAFPSPHAETTISYRSPTYTFTVSATPSLIEESVPVPSLSASEAKTALPLLIAKQMHRVHRLTDRCVTQTSTAVSCEASWASSQRLRSSTLLYSGDFHLERSGEKLHVRFAGRLRHYGCKPRNATRCGSAIRWREVH